MKNLRTMSLLPLLLIISISMISGGCAYMQKRGNDAMDIMDIGITVTEKPRFSLYEDFFSITPLGISNVDGKLIGIGNRHAGVNSFEDHRWGLLFWGQEKKGTGEFNPADFRQARPDQRDATERPTFNTGAIKMISEDNTPPKSHFIECDRALHIGWIGIINTVRPVEIIDFLLGWTTIDIMGDDDL